MSLLASSISCLVGAVYPRSPEVHEKQRWFPSTTPALMSDFTVSMLTFYLSSSFRVDSHSQVQSQICIFGTIKKKKKKKEVPFSLH